MSFVIRRGCDFFGLLHRQEPLGAPFKPGFGLSGIPQHSTHPFGHPTGAKRSEGICGFSSNFHAELLESPRVQVKSLIVRHHRIAFCLPCGQAALEELDPRDIDVRRQDLCLLLRSRGSSYRWGRCSRQPVLYRPGSGTDSLQHPAEKSSAILR